MLVTIWAQVSTHRVVLAAWSPVWKALLLRWCPPGTGRAIARVDWVPSDPPAHFLDLLRYMYTGAVSLTSSNVLPLLRLSNFYEIEPLKEVCHQGSSQITLLSRSA